MRVGCLIVAMLFPLLHAGDGAGMFRAESSLVLVNVSVLDSRDRPVLSLEQNQFHILDNGREQPIRSFDREDGPLSLAIILDTSGSMKTEWNRARTMLARFCENLTPGDQVAIFGVEHRAKLLQDFSDDCGVIQNSLILTQPHGTTALLDAIPLAVQRLRHARHRRHAILIISDGGENASRVHLSEIRRLAREANAQIYSATLGFGPGYGYTDPYGELDGPKLLQEIADFTGGRAFAIDDHRELEEAAASIARELHEQYVIGYSMPDNSDGKNHRILVKVQRAATQPWLTLFYRTNYRSAESGTLP